ncbi:MAG: hypothetical protein ACI4DR_01150, partial [Roseburia sp.]
GRISYPVLLLLSCRGRTVCGGWKACEISEENTSENRLHEGRRAFVGIETNERFSIFQKI